MKDDDVDDRFDPGQPADFTPADARDVTSIERRFGLFQAQVTDLLVGISSKLDRVLANDIRNRAELVDINKRLDRALDNLDGLDVRNRLSALEDVVLEKPKRRNGARK